MSGHQAGLQGARHAQGYTIVTTFNGGDSSFKVLNKVRILQSVNQPCIISLKDGIKMPKFIMLKLAEGRELFDKIIKKTKLNKALSAMCPVWEVNH